MNWDNCKKQVLTVGIIGAGYAAELHSKALKRIDPKIEQYIYDIDSILSKGFADKNGCRISDTLENLYDIVDAVIIATPVWTHHDLVLDCINHDKHILCEKPLAQDGKEAEVMYQLSLNSKLVCAVGFNYRFFNITKLLLLEVKEEQIQEIHLSIRRLFREDWKKDETSVLSDLGIHLLDLITVFGESSIDIQTCKSCMKYINLSDYDSKINGYTENQIAFSIEAARIENVANVCFCVTIKSMDRIVRFDSRMMDRYIVIDEIGEHTIKIPYEQTTKDFFDFSESIYRQDKEWINLIFGKSSYVLASFQDGYRSQIVLEALQKNNTLETR